MNATEHATSRARLISMGVFAVLALLFVAVIWQLGGFSHEPSHQGRTVTEWLDRLVLFDYREIPGRIHILPRTPEIVVRDPAFQALQKIGPKALPILVRRVSDRAEWGPEMTTRKRWKMWLEWKWQQLRGPQLNRPAPIEWSPSQRARKEAAAFILIGLGTNNGGGFSKYMEVYASAPKHETVYGTGVAGTPVGVYSSTVVRSVISVMPERREEILGEIMAALQHTNASYRVVATECAGVFREELLRSHKQTLIKLTGDEDPFVQQTALGHLIMIVQDKALVELMPATEIAQIAKAVLNDSKSPERSRGKAAVVLNLATNVLPSRIE